MKSPVSSARLALAATLALLSSPALQAATYYWDQNGTTGGFGSATGTWAAPTASRWSTSNAGTATPGASITTLNTNGTTDALNFGFGSFLGVSAGTITVSGTVASGNMTFAAASSAVVLSGGQINFSAAPIVTVDNASNTISSILGGAGTSFTKTGAGSLILTGDSIYTGSTIINAGTINLGGGTANGSLASTTLTLGGGLLSYTRTGTNTQTFTTTNINTQSATSITGAAGNTLNLGTVARGTGATLNFATTGLGIIAASTASHDATGIMAGFTHGDSWAVANGSDVAISGLADGSYLLSSDALDDAASYTGFNIDLDSSQTPDAAITVNSLRFSETDANTLTLQGTNTVTSGGILVGSGVGSNLSTITGGTLVGAASKDLSIIQNNTSGGLTISSIIANNGGATALTKSGAGLLTLGNSNTFTGGVFINAGTLAMADAGALNSGTPNNVTFGAGSTGILRLAGNNLTIPVLNTNTTSVGTPVIENANASNVTLTVNSASNSSFAGIIQNGTGTGTLALSKLGAGTLTLSGANTYTGGTTLNGGTIVITNSTSFGAGNVLVTGASRIDAAFSSTYANALDVGAALSLKAGLYTAADSSPGGTVTYSGILSGSGNINHLNSNTGNNTTIIDFTNANNTFTGSVFTATGNANGADYFRFNSIGDGGTFTLNKGGNRGGMIYSGASDIEFETRQIVLGTSLSTGNGTIGGYTATLSGLNGNGIPVNSFANNASDPAHTVTFFTDMAMTSVANNTFFYFDGSNTGNNTFEGDIGDPTGAQTLGIGKWGAGKWILSGNNSFEGDLFVANGTLAATTIDNALTNQSIGRGSFIILGHASTSGTLEYIGTADANTNKQVVLGNIRNNNQTGAGGIANNSLNGTLTFTNATFNSIAGSTLTTRARTLTLGGSNTGANEIQGIIQNNATGALVDLIKTGTGTWKLSGPNIYTGGTTISGGTLDVANVSGLGASGTLSINATSSIRLSTDTAFGGSNPVYNVQMTGVAFIGGGYTSTIELNRATPGAVTGITHNFGTMLITLNGGGAATLNVTAGANAPTGGALDTIAFTSMSAGNNNTVTETLNPTGGNISIGNLTAFGNQMVTMNLSGTTPGNTITGVIGGTGNQNLVAITKTGSSTWSLSGANTYTGPTAINGGTLIITGATQDTSEITFGGGNLGLAIGSPVNAANATIDFTGQQVLVTGTPTLPSYTLLTASSMIGEPTLASPIPGYALDVDGNQLNLVSTTSDPYDTWAGGPGVPFDEDANGDGVPNGLAWMLGALNKETNAVGLLPKVSENAGALVMEFTCLNLTGRGTATLLLQHSGDIGIDDDWVAVAVPDSATTVGTVVFTVPTSNPDPDLVDLRATIPVGEAIDGKLFGRLKAEKP